MLQWKLPKPCLTTAVLHSETKYYTTEAKAAIASLFTMLHCFIGGFTVYEHKWYSFIHMVLLQLTKVKPQLLCLDPDRLLFCINNIFVTFLLVCKYLFPTLMLSDWVGYIATMGQQTMAENQAKITRIQCHTSVRKSPIHTPCFIWQELTFPTVVSATNYPAVELQDKH